MSKALTDNDYFYGTWGKMHTRCYDPKYHSYHRYGGRGITVWPAWHTYQIFKDECFSTWWRGATLDRINNDGNYEPGNVRWLAKSQNTKPQVYNLKLVISLQASGKTQRQIAAIIGTDQAYVSRLLKKGLTRGL